MRIFVGVFLCSFLLLCVIVGGCSAQAKRAAPFDGPLTGQEMLLQIADASGGLKAGIYALDPFCEKPELRLLLPRGERPTWSKTRTYFAFLRDGALCVAERAGRTWVLNDTLDYEAVELGPGRPPLLWLPKDSFLYAGQTAQSGTVYMVGTGDDNTTTSPDGWLAWPQGLLQAPKEQPASDTAMGIHTQVVRSVDMSTASGDWVFELAPFAPMDLRREEAKLYLCDKAPVMQSRIDASVGNPTGSLHLRRLTSLPKGVSEHDPMWSPDGQWIAFTLVDVIAGYAAPAVCRPDGSGLKTLAVPSLHSATFTAYEESWHPPVAVSDLDEQGVEPMSWGRLCALPKQWAPDSSTLLFLSGFYGTRIPFLARPNGDNWEVHALGRPQNFPFPLATSLFELVLGPSSAAGGPAPVAFAYRTGDLAVFRAPYGTANCERVSLAPDVRILWLDW